MNIYGHVLPSMHQGAADQIDEALTDADGDEEEASERDDE